MKKLLIALIVCCGFATAIMAQPATVLDAARCTNDYFMQKYADPTIPTNVKKVRPSSLWTRAVYYEGLMALNAIDPQQRYIDYAMKWADFHKWTPRNGVNTCDADDQCCGQTYVELLPFTGKDYTSPNFTRFQLERSIWLCGKTLVFLSGDGFISSSLSAYRRPSAWRSLPWHFPP